MKLQSKIICLTMICTLSFWLGACSSDSTHETSESGTSEKAASDGSDLTLDSKESATAAAAAPSSTPAPKVEASYSNLSQAYKDQNDEGIAKAATAILSANPQDVKALNALGLYHYRKGHFEAARYFFNRALQVSPKAGELLNNLGLVALATGDEHEAIEDFRKAIDVNPNDGIVAANIGAIYARAGDYPRAVVALEIAKKKGMREQRTLTNYGVALAATGKYEEAKSAYDEAIKMNSGNKEAMFDYAILLIDLMKQYPEGLEQLSRLQFLGPAQEMRNRMNALENKAKTGIK